MGPPNDVRPSFRNAVKTSPTRPLEASGSWLGTSNQGHFFIASPVNSRTRSFARASPCLPSLVAL